VCGKSGVALPSTGRGSAFADMSGTAVETAIRVLAAGATSWKTGWLIVRDLEVLRDLAAGDTG
jgi:hypothetical protein